MTDSSDGTGATARALAATLDREIAVLQGEALPPGWTGKIWAMHQGIAYAETAKDAPDYFLLTDADIEYAPDAVTRLVARAKASSTRAHLPDGEAELRELGRARAHPGLRLLLPDALSLRLGEPEQTPRPRRRRAAACWSSARAARARAASRAIRAALIDDCALARLLKAEGPIWLGLTERVRSLRSYPQLRRHPPHGRPLGLCPARLLAAAAAATVVAGMALTYLAAPVLAAVCAVCRRRCCRRARPGR